MPQAPVEATGFRAERLDPSAGEAEPSSSRPGTQPGSRNLTGMR